MLGSPGLPPCRSCRAGCGGIRPHRSAAVTGRQPRLRPDAGQVRKNALGIHRIDVTVPPALPDFPADDADSSGAGELEGNPPHEMGAAFSDDNIRLDLVHQVSTASEPRWPWPGTVAARRPFRGRFHEPHRAENGRPTRKSTAKRPWAIGVVARALRPAARRRCAARRSRLASPTKSLRPRQGMSAGFEKRTLLRADSHSRCSVPQQTGSFITDGQLRQVAHQQFAASRLAATAREPAALRARNARVRCRMSPDLLAVLPPASTGRMSGDAVATSAAHSRSNRCCACRAGKTRWRRWGNMKSLWPSAPVRCCGESKDISN